MCGLGVDVGGGGVSTGGQLGGSHPGLPSGPEGQQAHGHVGASARHAGRHVPGFCVSPLSDQGYV